MFLLIGDGDSTRYTVGTLELNFELTVGEGTLKISEFNNK